MWMLNLCLYRALTALAEGFWDYPTQAHKPTRLSIKPALDQLVGANPVILAEDMAVFLASIALPEWPYQSDSPPWVAGSSSAWAGALTNFVRHFVVSENRYDNVESNQPKPI